MIHRTLIELIVATIFTILLIGCATKRSPAQQAKIDQFDRTIPTCDGEEDCKAKWEAAQLWVVHNAGYKIQTATSVLIETYNPTQYSSSLAVRVTKEPLGGGRYQIIVFPWCNNNFGCRRNPLDAGIDFNNKVGAATP